MSLVLNKIRLSLVIAMVAASWPVAAQDSLATSRAAAPQMASVPDTTIAIHRYFAHSRRHGRILLGVGAGAAIIGYTVAAANDKGGLQKLPIFLSGVLGVVVGTPVLFVGVVAIVAHSQTREQRIVRALEARRLPRRWVRRVLRPEFAQPTSPR